MAEITRSSISHSHTIDPSPLTLPSPRWGESHKRLVADVTEPHNRCQKTDGACHIPSPNQRLPPGTLDGRHFYSAGLV